MKREDIRESMRVRIVAPEGQQDHPLHGATGSVIYVTPPQPRGAEAPGTKQAHRAWCLSRPHSQQGIVMRAEFWDLPFSLPDGQVMVSLDGTYENGSRPWAYSDAVVEPSQIEPA